jgi:hypothetical protein
MPVETMPVEMRGVLLQDPAQVPFAGDQHPVGELTAARMARSAQSGRGRVT